MSLVDVQDLGRDQDCRLESNWGVYTLDKLLSDPSLVSVTLVGQARV